MSRTTGKFKVGDLVLAISKYGEFNADTGSRVSRELMGTGRVGKITQIKHDVYVVHTLEFCTKNPEYSGGDYFYEEDLTKYGGTTMETTQEPAKFVRVEKNTELFSKGSVFELYSSNYYRAMDVQAACIDATAPSIINAQLPVETVQRLSKVFVPVTKFDPAYVTEDENEKLQNALKVKTPAKKTAKKASK